jgi:hypothetical protein
VNHTNNQDRTTMCIIETGFDDEKMQQLLQSDRGLAVLL